MKIKRKITLRGGDIEIDASEEFLERIRVHFGLTDTDSVKDDHVRLFVCGSIKSAIDRTNFDNN